MFLDHDARGKKILVTGPTWIASFGALYRVVMTNPRHAAYIKRSNTSGMAECRTVGPLATTCAGKPGDCGLGT